MVGQSAVRYRVNGSLVCGVSVSFHQPFDGWAVDGGRALTEAVLVELAGPAEVARCLVPALAAPAAEP